MSETTTTKDELMSAMDTLATLKRERASYDALRDAATRIVELRIAIEKQLYGRVKLNRKAMISALMR